MLVALALRVAHHHQALQCPLLSRPLPIFDSQFYDKYAHRIADGHLLADDVFFMAPLYQYVVGVSYWLLGDDLSPTLLAQSVLGSLTCGLVYWIGLLLFGRAAGVLSGLFAATEQTFIYYDCLLMPNSLILFVHMAALLALIMTARRPSRIRWLATGLLLGLSAVAHGSALMIIVAVFAWLLSGKWSPGEASRRTAMSLVALGVALPIAPVAAHNIAVGGDLVMLTSNAGLNFLIGNNAGATGTFMRLNLPYKGAQLPDYIAGFERGPQDPAPSQLSRMFRNEAVQHMVSHPLRTLSMMTHKLRFLFNRADLSVGDNYTFFKRYSTILQWPLPGYGVVGALGLAAICFSLRSWRTLLPAYLFIGSQVVVYALTFVLSRYRLVLVACLMPLAAAQVVIFWQWIRQKQLAGVALGVLAVSAFAWMIHRPIPGISADRGFGQQFASVARAFEQTGNIVEAEENYKAALAANFDPYSEQQRLGQIVDIRLSLAEIFSTTGRPAEAVRSLEQSLEDLKSLMTPSHWKDGLQQKVELRLLDARLQMERARR